MVLWKYICQHSVCAAPSVGAKFLIGPELAEPFTFLRLLPFHSVRSLAFWGHALAIFSPWGWLKVRNLTIYFLLQTLFSCERYFQYWSQAMAGWLNIWLFAIYLVCTAVAYLYDRYWYFCFHALVLPTHDQTWKWTSLTSHNISNQLTVDVTVIF